MRGQPGRAGLGSLVPAVALGAALVWALLHFGGTEAHTPYLLLLILAVPALALCFVVPLDRAALRRWWLLGLVGSFLSARVALAPAVEGAGYVHLSIGWLALVLGLWAVRSGRRAMLALTVFLVLVGTAEALFGLLQALGGDDQIGSHVRDAGQVATGTFFNRNHLAGLLNMVIGVALGLMYAGGSQSRSGSRGTAWRWPLLAAISVMGLAVLLSNSRGGTLSLVASLGFCWFLAGRANRAGQGLWRRGGAVVLVALAIAGLAGLFGVGGLWSRIERIPEANRPAVYRDTLAMIADHPLVGVGPGMYRWRFRPYQGEDLDRLYEHAHNDYLQAAAEWGIPLAVGFWTFVVRRFLGACRVFRESEAPWVQAAGLGAATAIFSILVHSFVDFNLQIPSNAIVFFIVVAISWSLERWRPIPPRAPSPSQVG